MNNEGQEVHVSETEARAGSTPGVVRRVLVIGLVLAVVLLSIIWMTGALSQGEAESEVSVSDRMQAQDADGSGTDSIVSDDADNIEAVADETAPDTPLDTVDN